LKLSNRAGLSRAVEVVLFDCLGVQKGERVLIVTDQDKRALADAFVVAARDFGSEVMLMEMSERATHGSEPPEPVVAAMSASDVVLAPTSKSLSHTAARKAATDKGVRVATMPDITEEMLVRTMSADYSEIKRRSQVLASKLSEGHTVSITSRTGTELELSIEGRTGLADDGDLKSAGAFGNLPAGEGFIAPVEGLSKGRVVFDGSVWPLGKLDEPLVIDIEDGYAISFSGFRAQEFESLLAPHGKDAFAVAELGVGTNEAAKLTGNVLEDEKILGSTHIAFGDNHTFGGVLRVASHQDGILLEPTVSIDGDVILDNKELFV
jgi:leucyl aminopeptidase (aminopeptidase T)